jgi:hypothetical protein
MKRIERSHDRSVRLEELPDEPLCGVDSDEEIEPQRDRKGMPSSQHEKRYDERDHDGRLVQLHRVPPHAIAEVDAPGQRGRRAVRMVVQSGQKAADPPDRYRRRERHGESHAGRSTNPGASLEQLDTHDAAG